MKIQLDMADSKWEKKLQEGNGGYWMRGVGEVGGVWQGGFGKGAWVMGPR
jgi:hypothetical protein